MSFLLFLRDKVLPKFTLLCIVIGGFWGIGWLFAQTYFWNTSDVTFLIDEEITSVKINISARIIYRDIPLFWWDIYPFHLTLPYSREIKCVKECIFSDIPAGDARVIFTDHMGATQSEKVIITADTQWVIDMRMPIRVREVMVEKIIKNQNDISKTDIIPGSILSANTVQGLWLFYDKWLLFLYDASTQQKILLSNTTKIRAVARWMQDGVYYFTTDTNEVEIFDRYGRQKTEKVTHSDFKDQDLIWEIRNGEVTTRLVSGEKTRVLFGRLFWFLIEEKPYLFDGEKVFEIINN